MEDKVSRARLGGKEKGTDPKLHMPKPAANAYMLFCKATRPSVRDELEVQGLSTKPTDVTRVLAARWNELSEGHRKRWEKKAAAKKLLRDDAVSLLGSSLGPKLCTYLRVQFYPSTFYVIFNCR